MILRFRFLPRVRARNVKVRRQLLVMVVQQVWMLAVVTCSERAVSILVTTVLRRNRQVTRRSS